MKKYEERLKECKKETDVLSGLCRDIIKRLRNSKCYHEKAEIGILVPYYDKMDRLNSEIYELKFDMTPNVGSVVYIKELSVIGLIREISPINELDDNKDNQYLNITYKVVYYGTDSNVVSRYWFNDDEIDTVIYDSLSLEEMVKIDKLSRY